MHNFNSAKICSLERISAYTTGKSLLKLLVVIKDVRAPIMGGDEVCQSQRGLPSTDRHRRRIVTDYDLVQFEAKLLELQES